MGLATFVSAAVVIAVAVIASTLSSCEPVKTRVEAWTEKGERLSCQRQAADRDGI